MKKGRSLRPTIWNWSLLRLEPTFTASNLVVASETNPVDWFEPLRPLSDCEDDPAEGAAFNKITQSICGLGQRESLCHDRFDRAGVK